MNNRHPGVGRIARSLRFAVAFFGLAAMLDGSIGCVTTQMCTEMACNDGFNLTTRTADKSWAPGEYLVEVTVDGAKVQCSYTWSAGANENVSAACEQGPVSIDVMPLMKCTESKNVDTVSLKCDPIPGQFEQKISVTGKPTSVSVAVKRDGVDIGQQSFSPAYHAVYPNGESCGGECQQASAEWAM